MKRETVERLRFLLFSIVVLLFAAGYRPTIYGNDPASIERYIMETAGERLGDHVELLAVEDRGEDRFVLFRRQQKKPDDVWIVRFRQNEGGKYEAYSSRRPYSMYCARPGSRIYTEFLTGWDDDRSVYFVGWSENPKVETLWLRFDEQPEMTLPIKENPSLTILEFQAGYGGFHASHEFRDAQGNEV
ncbi:hypothetical protein [Oscillibacter sp.]|uniref:hypothetical protein n=1 Tax=Oscillibacter sp. TaxID=1945593 RepID=UPI00261F5259|nr:hypothetical protein [Oscillibacter sp.]MDD3347429.1 hypothetical protein [Oscillibacter sp.]